MGAYRGDDGKPFVLDSVRKAEKLVLDKSLNHEYAGIAGKINEQHVSPGARMCTANAYTASLRGRACPARSQGEAKYFEVMLTCSSTVLCCP